MECPLLYSRLLCDCVSAKSLQSCPSLQPRGLQPTSRLCPGDPPSKNTDLSGLLCSPPGDLPDPGIETVSHVSCIGQLHFLKMASCLHFLSSPQVLWTKKVLGSDLLSPLSLGWNIYHMLFFILSCTEMHKSQYLPQTFFNLLSPLQC